MRTLLIVLLFLIAVAQIAAVLPVLSISEAPWTVKAAPILMAIGAIISAVFLFRKSSRAFIPYFAGFAAFVILTVMAFGTESLPKAAPGLVIGLLFFVPALKSPK